MTSDSRDEDATIMDPNETRNAPKDDPDFHTLEERKAFDRSILMKKAMESGMTREQAKRHVDEHYAGEARVQGKSAEDATEDLRDVGIRNPDYD